MGDSISLLIRVMIRKLIRDTFSAKRPYKDRKDAEISVQLSLDNVRTKAKGMSKPRKVTVKTEE